MFKTTSKPCFWPIFKFIFIILLHYCPFFMTSKPILFVSNYERKCSSSYIVKNVKKIVGTLASYRMLELLLHGKPYTHQIHFSTLLPYRIKQIHIIQHLYIFTYQINACCPLWQTNRIPISPAMNKIQHIIYQHTFSHFHKVLQQIHIIQHTHTHIYIHISNKHTISDDYKWKLKI